MPISQDMEILCNDDNDNDDKTDYFTSCTCVQGKYTRLQVTYISKSRYICGETKILPPRGSSSLYIGGSLDGKAHVGHILLLLIGQK